MEYLGLPTLTNSSYPECSVHGMDAGWCNRQRMFLTYSPLFFITTLNPTNVY